MGLAGGESRCSPTDCARLALQWCRDHTSLPASPFSSPLLPVHHTPLQVPSERVTALQVCAHPFFDELRHPDTVLPDGAPLPPLFNFTSEELAAA